MRLTAEMRSAIDAVYGDPDPYETAESWIRHHHDDIPALALDAIDAERLLARLRWAFLIYAGQQPSAWLTERLARLDDRAATLRGQGRGA